MKFAARMKNLVSENAFEVLAEVEKLRQNGEQIISFAIGEPDADTPENVKEAGCSAIARNLSKYGPSAGLLDLRQVIAEHINQTRGTKYRAENVVVTPGAKPVIFYTIMALVNPGDEVICPNPGFPTYESVVRFAGGVPDPFFLRGDK